MLLITCTSQQIWYCPVTRQPKDLSLQEADDSAVAGPFEDEDTRAFYESLPDVRAVVPAVLLGGAAPVDNSEQLESASQSESALNASDSIAPDATISDNGDADAGESYSVQHRPLRFVSAIQFPAVRHNANACCDICCMCWRQCNALFLPVASVARLGVAPLHLRSTAMPFNTWAACTESTAGANDSTAETEALGGAKNKSAVDALLAQLPKCISRDLCDELSVNFCYLNSKAARKRLVRVLCETHRSNLQLLPFYARVAAILSQVFPDVGAAVLKSQEDEFNYLQV